MKVKVGDTVVPKFRLGKVIGITKQKVVIEWFDSNQVRRLSELTEEQAHTRSKTLDEHVDESLVIVNV